MSQPGPSSMDDTLAARFETQVLAHPDAPALVWEEKSMTYRALKGRADEIAARLRHAGAGPGNLVGIYLDRSFDLVAAILGILKAGAAYLPLDFNSPEDRLRFVLGDAGAAAVLTHSSLAHRFGSFPGKVLCVDREGDSPSEAPENRESTHGPAELAYVIYTSGSTGQPKGVCVTQKNVLRLFDVTRDLFHFGPGDVWTLFHSCAFDFSVWEIFGALLHGGRLVIVPYAVSRSAADFRELLVREQVTVLNQTPSAFRQLIQADLAGPVEALALRYVMFGGEALEFQSLRPWFERHGDARPRLVNMYGITETTVHVTHHAISLADLEVPGSNIGAPLPDLKVYLVDEKGARVAGGAVGEMWVGGAGVASGYLNRPELTAARFIPNPFEPEIAPMLYRSGDLARRRANGDLEYLGRTDHQVQVRGFRVELPEIEAALARHPAVRECAVLFRGDDGREPRLVAYLASAAGGAPVVEDLRAHLARTLPDYMVPADFVFLAAFPLTLNGKLDRAALPVPGTERPALAAGYLAPSNELEKTVARLWQKALRRGTVGTDDNFFDLGGDSLLLTAVHRDMQAELGREIPITELFQFPTIRALAEHLSRGDGGADFDAKTQARAQRQRAVLSRGRRSTPTEPLAP